MPQGSGWLGGSSALEQIQCGKKKGACLELWQGLLVSLVWHDCAALPPMLSHMISKTVFSSLASCLQ